MGETEDSRAETRAGWRALLAVGLVAEDRSVAGIARYGGVGAREAVTALDEARSAGVIDEVGAIDPITATGLISELDSEHVAEIHAAVARHLFASGPDFLPEAIRHLRAAVTTVPLDELLTMVDRGGRLSLALGEYATAHELLGLGVDYDTSTDFVAQGHRLCDLAEAADGLGRVGEARQHLARAVSLGELAHDAALVARAAILHALPVDWYAGDARTLGFLHRAAAMPGNDNIDIALTAARALAEIRIPVTGDHDRQWAWVTRPHVAQPLAERALAECGTCSDEVQLLSHMAWRTTHRAPRFLSRRREVSARAADLAQRQRQATFQVEAAVWMAVDALESGDRGRYDEGLSMALWVSRADGNPRLRWRALTLAAGAALLDGDDDALERHRITLKELGDEVISPGAEMVDAFFVGQQFIRHDDERLAMLRLGEDSPALSHPLIRAGSALVEARCGNRDAAIRHARRSLNQIDMESSFLLVATRVAHVAIETGDEFLLRDARSLLEPWSSHVSVDGNGWWCDGPVSLWLGGVERVLGDLIAAEKHFAVAEPMARRLNDVTALRHLDTWRTTGVTLDPTETHMLTSREVEVLGLLATGATNPAIADRLSYSVSTIRIDTISIYRKLGVSGRAEAVAKALSLGLVERRG